MATPQKRASVARAWLALSSWLGSATAWLKLLALDGDLASAEPKILRYASCTPPEAQ